MCGLDFRCRARRRFYFSGDRDCGAKCGTGKAVQSGDVFPGTAGAKVTRLESSRKTAAFNVRHLTSPLWLGKERAFGSTIGGSIW